MPILIPEQDPTNASLWPVPPSGKVLAGINLAGQWTLKYPDSSIAIVAASNAFHAQTCDGGNGTISPAGVTSVEKITQTGGGGTRQFAISVAGIAPGSLLFVQNIFPTVTGIRVQIFNANRSGELLADYTSDGSGDPLATIFYFDGTQWNLLQAAVAAT